MGLLGALDEGGLLAGHLEAGLLEGALEGLDGNALLGLARATTTVEGERRECHLFASKVREFYAGVRTRMSEPSEKRQKLSPPGEPRGAGAGSGAGSGATPPTFRPPTTEELRELRELLDPGEIRADAVLTWLTSHPDVRTDYVSRDDMRGRYFFTSILGSLMDADHIPASHPVMAEALRRQPDLNGQKDRDGKTMIQTYMDIYKNRVSRGDSQYNTKASRKNLRDKLLAMKGILDAREALVTIPGLEDLANEKGLDEGVKANIAGFLSGSSASDSTETQMDKLRKKVGMTNKAGGRRKIKRGKKTRRARRR